MTAWRRLGEGDSRGQGGEEQALQGQGRHPHRILQQTLLSIPGHLPWSPSLRQQPGSAPDGSREHKRLLGDMQWRGGLGDPRRQPRGFPELCHLRQLQVKPGSQAEHLCHPKSRGRLRGEGSALLLCAFQGALWNCPSALPRAVTKPARSLKGKKLPWSPAQVLSLSCPGTPSEQEKACVVSQGWETTLKLTAGLVGLSNMQRVLGEHS